MHSGVGSFCQVVPTDPLPDKISFLLFHTNTKESPTLLYQELHSLFINIPCFSPKQKTVLLRKKGALNRVNQKFPELQYLYTCIYLAQRLQVQLDTTSITILHRREAVLLVDAFDIRDEILNSVLGRYDGDVYTHLYQWALNAPRSKEKVC